MRSNRASQVLGKSASEEKPRIRRNDSDHVTEVRFPFRSYRTVHVPVCTTELSFSVGMTSRRLCGWPVLRSQKMQAHRSGCSIGRQCTCSRRPVASLTASNSTGCLSCAALLYRRSRRTPDIGISSGARSFCICSALNPVMSASA